MYMLDGELKTDPNEVSRVLGTERGNAYQEQDARTSCGNNFSPHLSSSTPFEAFVITKPSVVKQTKFERI